MNLDPICPRCFKADETIEHILFQCIHAKEVWELSNIPIHLLLPATFTSEQFIAMLLDSIYDSDIPSITKQLPFWILWHIWKSRNNFTFNSIQDKPITVRAKGDVADWNNHNSQTNYHQTQSSHNSNQKWNRPTTTSLKCNYDAAYDHITSKAKAGWILCDKNGISNGWGAMALGITTSPLEAEAKALLTALQQRWIRGIN
ncbi:PREDICTED: uncharacterized protein LOC109127391 [Camelina sativa]|uniref:Uncharacterized protein LOC109127391 n=1 Tax=Camelina sativa TaxID=90675 RepID=A0ABM1QLD1_CAMSA|nr:PREDICTED: uncharacterized protein LOC109127391 [Camelina sativa]